jgi:imidazolonepropionase-like amidohydrolase
MMSKRILTLAGGFLLASALVLTWDARRAVRAFDGEAVAIRGGTVVTVAGATIPKGTVVIRGGLITAVGAEVAIPADARIIDATGMTVYPGLIDSYTNLGLPSAAPTQGGGGRGGGAPAIPVAFPVQQPAAAAAPTPIPAGLNPEVRSSDNLKIAADTFDTVRSAGITTVLTASREGIFQGQAALINLGGTDTEKLILKSPATLNIAMGRGGFGGYPTSLMGVISFLRQSFLDAQYHREVSARYEKNKRGMERPTADKSSAALQPYLNGELPVVVLADNTREIRRAINFAEEFGLKYLIAGGAESYAVADLLKQKNATVLLSLNYPQRPTNLDNPEDEPLRTIKARAEAPKAAVALHKAGVRFAFQSGYLVQPRDFINNAARAIEAGLPKDEAIKAMTLYPAQIFGVAEQLGTLETGKIANIVVTSGDLFDRRSQVKYVFVDGVQYEVKVPAPAMAGGPGGRGPGGRGPGGPVGVGGGAAAVATGSWALQINTPNGPLSATLTLQASGGGLSGEMVSQLGTTKVNDIQLNGNELSFNYTINIQGNEIPVSARGTIEGNSIRGTMNATGIGQQSEFSGTRTPRSNEE